MKLVKNAQLKVIPGAPHGLCGTIPNQVNNELLAFLRAQPEVIATRCGLGYAGAGA